MRITNSIIQRSVLANLQLNMGRMLDAQEAMATGKIIRTASKDLIEASQVMRTTGCARRAPSRARARETTWT